MSMDCWLDCLCCCPLGTLFEFLVKFTVWLEHDNMWATELLVLD